MRERRKGDGVSWNRFCWCTLCIVFSCVILSGFTFSSFRLFSGERYMPLVVPAWRNPAMEAVSMESAVAPAISVREIVIFPDQAMVFLSYPPSGRLLTKEDLLCIYSLGNSSKPQFQHPPIAAEDGADANGQMVRCPLQSGHSRVALMLRSDGSVLSGPSHHWNKLVYEALIDRDNTTVVFVKGLNLRPGKVSNSSRFECLYGWDFRRPRFVLRTEVLSIAQEIVRCETPLSVLNGGVYRGNRTVKVSLRVKGGGLIFNSIAQAGLRRAAAPSTQTKAHEMCICTMVRNQARFIKEWVVYHSKVGVNRWFIYDNNSDDDPETLVDSLNDAGFNVSRHTWPWIKTQEAGFAHCALRARPACEWVGFIDVDEFFHMPAGLDLGEVLRNWSGMPAVSELRVSCHSFGPSGLKERPRQGVTVGYTCRMATPERHKSIVRPEALNSTLINVVHHFHLRDGFEFVNVDRGIMVINHYKYQVWDVFKEKFYRRVATYVADWQEEQNAGSKDRAPGLGTRAIEPPDWSNRFCEVQDTGLRDQVLQEFADPRTHNLPWQEAEDGDGDENRTEQMD
ncbi:hypothetical protein SAY87_008615 [Trapa incisa]|uniref:Glycosyltransferase family 92 protein n=1 Tax=Trapa incisa TaxID=236973 RepID=A0AAN7JUP1_9MYRT|nr:hypothetical protein SAY87_008615 [Trapa incisa]